jgi:zinc protease
MIKFKAEEKLGFKGALETNNFWENYLIQQYQTDEKPENVLDYENLLNGLTKEKIKNAARSYLDGRNYIRLVLFPETIAEQGVR